MGVWWYDLGEPRWPGSRRRLEASATPPAHSNTYHTFSHTTDATTSPQVSLWYHQLTPTHTTRQSFSHTTDLPQTSPLHLRWASQIWPWGRTSLLHTKLLPPISLDTPHQNAHARTWSFITNQTNKGSGSIHPELIQVNFFPLLFSSQGILGVWLRCCGVLQIIYRISNSSASQWEFSLLGMFRLYPEEKGLFWAICFCFGHKEYWVFGCVAS